MFNYKIKNKFKINRQVLAGSPVSQNKSFTRWQINLFVKRVADVFFSMLLLVLLSPVIVVVSILIKIDSPGSIFYQQTRIGLEEKPFQIYKFRTMIEDADILQARLENKNEVKGGVLFKIKQDPRITQIGKYLRRYSIDEIPQLINVIKGDMSLVGPRPLTIRDCAKISQSQHFRHSVLPGITGLWQVKVRSGGNSKQLYLYDSFYIKNWSLKLDALILLKTFLVVIRAEGAF